MEKRDEHSEFTGLSREDLVLKLEELLNDSEVQEIISAVDDIESAYQECNRERSEQELQTFLDEGGYASDFVLQKDKTDSRFTELYNIFRDRKDKFFEEKKTRERDNLYAKRQVIDELKALIEKGDSVGKAFHQFRELRDRWRTTGEVPKGQEEALQSDYRFQVERFYHIMRITQGLKELDLQKHYEAKAELLKRMEELLQEKTIRKVEALVRKYHDDWYDIGPVPESKKDEVIGRFNEITNKIYAKVREHYEGLNQKYLDNLKVKEALCADVEAIAAEEYNHFREWGNKTKEILDKQQVWRKTGRVPKENSDQIWERFRKACNEFFEKKRAFFRTLKEGYDENKKAKVSICEQAEALQSNTDWEATAKKLIGLQRKWEKTAPAGPKDERQLWQRFRAACDKFFDARKNHFAAQDEERKNNLAAREAIINKLNELIPSITSADALPTLKAIAQEWESAGEVPIKLREDIFRRYSKAVDECYEKMGMNEKDKEMLKFGNKIERLKGSPDAVRLLEDEKRFLRNKIRSLEDEVAKTENNMGFFAKSDKVAALLQDVMKNVEQTKEQLESFQKKLELLEKNLPKKAQIR